MILRGSWTIVFGLLRPLLDSGRIAQSVASGDRIPIWEGGYQWQ